MKKATKIEADNVRSPSDELSLLDEACIQGRQREDNGMPSLGENLPYVLPESGSDSQWCLKSIRDHTAGQAQGTSVKPISGIVPLLSQVYDFFIRSGAPAAHGSLISTGADVGISRSSHPGLLR